MKSALGILVPALLLALLERSSWLRFRPLAFLRPYFATDVIYLATGYVAGASLALAYVAAGSAALGRLGVPRLAALDLPLWISVPLALVALDAGNYLAHWLLHGVDALWEFHKVHHSSRTLDWLATFRSHFIEQALRRLVAPVLLVIAGFPLDAVVVAAGLFTAWATFNHSNLRVRLGPLEAWLVESGVPPCASRPSHHRAEPGHRLHGLGHAAGDARARGAHRRRRAGSPARGVDLSPGLARPASRALCRHPDPAHGVGSSPVRFREHLHLARDRAVVSSTSSRLAITLAR